MATKRSLDKRISERIKLSRKKHNLTQTKLSEIIGKNQKYINLIECGKEPISLTGLIDVAAALNEPIEYFLVEKKEDYTNRINRLSEKDKNIIITLLEHFEETEKSSITE